MVTASATCKANGDDAFLVIDKNNNGNIDNINEMFGNQTIPALVAGSGEAVAARLAANDNYIDNATNFLTKNWSGI